LIFSLRLQKGIIYPIAIDLTGVKGFTMWLTGISPPNASHPASAVDVIADHIS
jgi:hypothetical protein